MQQMGRVVGKAPTIRRWMGPMNSAGDCMTAVVGSVEDFDAVAVVSGTRSLAPVDAKAVMPTTNGYPPLTTVVDRIAVVAVRRLTRAVVAVAIPLHRCPTPTPAMPA